MGNSKIVAERLDLHCWKEMMNKGTIHSVSGLSQMLGKEINITSFNLRPFSAEDACELVGGPETPMVGIYLAIGHGASGHILILYPPKVAFELIDMLMGREPGSTQNLGEMEESVLAEIGNVAGSYFLSSISDDTGIRLLPTPPQVMVGMTGAIMGDALEDILGKDFADDIFVIEGMFGSSDREVRGVLIVLPSPDLIDTVKKHSNGK